MRNCAPVITRLQSAFGRIDDCLVITVFHIPLRWKLHEPVQVSLLNLRVKSSLVKRIKVMADMHELSTIEYFIIALALDIGTDEATHPIISDYDRGEDFELAEGLKSD